MSPSVVWEAMAWGEVRRAARGMLLMLNFDLQVLTAIKHASGSKSCFNQWCFSHVPASGGRPAEGP